MDKLLKQAVNVGLAIGLALSANPAVASTHTKTAQHDKKNILSTIQGKTLSIGITADGSYFLTAPGIAGDVLHSDVEADVDNQILRSTDYPQHKIARSEFHDDFGSGAMLTVTHTGLQGKPDLLCVFRLYQNQSWGDIKVELVNSTNNTITVSSIRSVHTVAAPILNLNGPATDDRVLSDSYSEDRPALKIRDLANGIGEIHRAAGSQLIYNRQSGESFFLGALTSDRFLTIFHLKEVTTGGTAHLLSYDAVATGTTEIMKGESLRESPASEQVNLSLSVKPGDTLPSERLMFSAGNNYHSQLEDYGHVIRSLHKARVDTPTPIGWWSWTAYYFGLNQGTALTNAEWLAQNLKSLGYTYFHIDEGYQYARGEYQTSDAKLFPLGMKYIGDRARHNGLTFGVWTAPFEVSDRSWVYQNHKDWLLHNSAGQLIHIGYVTDHNDPLYVLDTTNPGSQEYLRQTYSTLVNDWGIRFIKMDFMDDSAVEGAYYRPNTTALEAQRIGLEIIRKTVGEHVVLDKDGSPMLNPVGIVDAGRISQDTGHTFSSSKDAAPGIAARYYMNRNFFVADPDAFTVSNQVVDDQSWHGGQHPLTLDEAKVSIALTAVSGGMFEIGDDLPTLGDSPERLALVKNKDLIDMARLGRASIPVDLMNYAPSDEQPSIFLLKEDRRQSILTVFNWTDQEHKRTIDLTKIGLQNASKYTITDLFDGQDCCSNASDTIDFSQQPHSVRMFKLVDKAIPPAPPAFQLNVPSNAKAAETLTFQAKASSPEEPVLTCHWDFGDGVSLDGMQVHHAYTHQGEYTVHVTSIGLNTPANTKSFNISVSGEVSTRFVPAEKERPNK